MVVRVVMFFIFMLAYDVKALTQIQVEQQLGYKQLVCNNCTTYASFENMALSSGAQMGRVVVSNIESGELYAFEIVREREPGFEITYVNSISAPAVAITGLSEYRSMLVSASSFGIPDASATNLRSPNIPVLIPSSITSINTSSARVVLNDESALMAVSNYLRSTLFGSLSSPVTLSKLALAALQKLTVTVTFSDGSKMSFILSNPFESAMPFKAIDGSAVDASGAKISTSSIIGGSGGGFVVGGGTFIRYRSSCEIWSFPDGFGGRYTMELNCRYSSTP